MRCFRRRNGQQRGHTEERVRQLELAVDEARHELRQSTAQYTAMVNAALTALSNIIEKRDPYTAGHQQRVAEISQCIASELGLPTRQTEAIGMAALVHDIGKIGVPAEILSKPASLTSAERSLIQSHCTIGMEIIDVIEWPWPIVPVIHQHHERLDGSGYPEGLMADSIGFEARVVAVADVVEAMSSNRPYRPACGIDAALEEIRGGRGVLYDRDVVDACCSGPVTHVLDWQANRRQALP